MESVQVQHVTLPVFFKAWERLYRIQFPQIWFPYGFRDRPWYQMAKMDFKVSLTKETGKAQVRFFF